MRKPQKKVSIFRRTLPKPGQRVVLEKLPPGFLDGLPEEDQRAILSIVGTPVRFSGFDDAGLGLLELEFVEKDGTIHFISVNREFVRAAKSGRKKSIKRRK